MVPLAELKAYLGIGIDAPDTSEDVQLFEMERNAVHFLQAQTGRYFGPPVEFEEVILGSGGRRIWLSEPPIANPESGLPLAVVSESSYAGAAPTDPAFEEDTDFVVRYLGFAGTPGYTGILMRLGSGTLWTSAFEYAVTYWRGYPYGTEPGDIRQLVLDLCSVKRSTFGQEWLKSETMGGYAYSRFGDSDLDATANGNATIAAWRRLVFA